jgi:predicted DNA-binding mobile mystery protein A
MRKEEQKLLLEQIDRRIAAIQNIDDLVISEQNWISTIRKSLNMTLSQLAKRMNTTKQNVQTIEMREREGKVTIGKLAQAADALECKLVYAFIPKEGSLKKMIENQAFNTAKQIVLRTSQTMKLEDQENNPERINKAIKELSEKIQSELPKYLWD